jgi:hypothetical protein
MINVARYRRLIGGADNRATKDNARSTLIEINAPSMTFLTRSTLASPRHTGAATMAGSSPRGVDAIDAGAFNHHRVSR